MLSRIGFSVKKAWQYRAALKKIAQHREYQVRGFLDFSPEAFQQAGGKILVLDYDGVLAPHGKERLSQEILNKIKQCRAVLGEECVFLLTNRLTLARCVYFKTHFFSMRLIEARKKPYPDGLEKIMALTQTTPHELLLIDDRLLTGVLASVIVGCQVRWVRSAMMDFQHNFLAESFFCCLRTVEAKIFNAC